MKALVFERKELRYAAATIGSRVSPGIGSQVGPLRLKDIDPPEIAGDGWVRVFPFCRGYAVATSQQLMANLVVILNPSSHSHSFQDMKSSGSSKMERE